MLVLQSCTDSPHFLAEPSTETFPASCDGTLDIGNIKVEERIDIKEEEEWEVNVKTENIIGSEEEECMDIKNEEGMYSEEEDVDIKEEVSFEYTV